MAIIFKMLEAGSTFKLKDRFKIPDKGTYKVIGIYENKSDTGFLVLCEHHESKGRSLFNEKEISKYKTKLDLVYSKK